MINEIHASNPKTKQTVGKKKIKFTLEVSTSKNAANLTTMESPV